jgi:hypothetical protein
VAMTTATGRRGTLETTTVDPDCLTREEYLRLNGSGVNAEAQRNGSKSPQNDSGVPGSVPASGRPGGAERAADAVRRCRGPGCGKPLPAGSDPRTLYCSGPCRRAAKDARLAARLRGVVNGNGTVSVAEPVAVEPAARASVAAASPGPAAADGIAPLVVELLALGAGDVELERGGWRLRGASALTRGVQGDVEGTSSALLHRECNHGGRAPIVSATTKGGHPCRIQRTNATKFPADRPIPDPADPADPGGWAGSGGAGKL